MPLKKCSRCGKEVYKKFANDKPFLCRDCYHYEWSKKRRKEWVKNKCCAQCGKKVKPKIIISYRCENCLDKIRSKLKSKNSKSDD